MGAVRIGIRDRQGAGGAGHMKTILPLFLLASLVAACDPCAGTSACRASTPQLVMDGQIVRARDGRGVDGVRITVMRTGGAATESDSLTAVTSDGGFWRVATGVTQPGDVEVAVEVATPELPHPYVVDGLHVTPVSREGDAYVADRWVVDPYYPYYVEFFRRGRPTEVFPAMSVKFRQTGGPLVRGASADSIVFTGTDSYGRAQMFVYNAFASDTGEIVGDVTAALPAPYGPSTVSGIRLRPTYLYRAPGIVPRVGVGPSLEYAAAVFDRATGKTIPGARMTFTRVGGIDTSPRTFTTTADAFGYVHFHVLPLGIGDVIADITLYPPNGNPEAFRDTVPTFDSDVPRLFANWTAGAILPYYGIVRSFGSNLAGVPVRIRRTGGVEITPADTVIHTREDGVLPLSPRPLGAGNVTLELTFTPPAPYPSFVVRNLVLSTVQHDVQSGSNVWIWDLDRGITAPPGTQVVVAP